MSALRIHDLGGGDHTRAGGLPSSPHRRRTRGRKSSGGRQLSCPPVVSGQNHTKGAEAFCPRKTHPQAKALPEAHQQVRTQVTQPPSRQSSRPLFSPRRMVLEGAKKQQRGQFRRPLIMYCLACDWSGVFLTGLALCCLCAAVIFCSAVLSSASVCAWAALASLTVTFLETKPDNGVSSLWSSATSWTGPSRFVFL